MALPTDEDFYKPFTKEQWVEWQEMAQATELQLLFSIHKFRGASAVQSARLAGYSGNGDTLKKTAYEAVRSNGVVKLMQFAMASAPLEISKLTEEELDRVIAGLVRSKDPQSIKVGVEQYEKRKQRAREAGETPEDDGLTEWRICRDYLLQENGATQFMLWYRAAKKDLGHPANYPLLHDVHSLSQREPYGVQIWEWCVGNLSESMRDHLYGLLSNPDWQLEARQKIWAEIGVRLDDRGHFGGANAA